MMASSLSLKEWGEVQFGISAAKMAKAVSATSLIKHRPGFGQTVRPAKGSVLAAIGSAGAGVDPDYFFHWLRDSATVMDAALILIRAGIDAEAWQQRFADFVRFSLDLNQISGRRFLVDNDLLNRTAPDMQQFLRPDKEIAAIEGEAVLGEVRYNADGTLDFLRWCRPQYDGPAARALTCLRHLSAGAVLPDAQDAAVELLRGDLNYSRAHADEPCIDIWEEEFARHYYTCLMQYEALRRGALWATERNDAAFALALSEARDAIEDELEDFHAQGTDYCASRLMPEGETTTKALDFAVILGVLHSGRRNGRNSVWDTRIAATLQKLEAQFAADYAINRAVDASGVAFGRYPGDSYVSGGAWFLCTFGAAEFCYRHAARFHSVPERARRTPELIAKGDGFFEMARCHIPASGEISEQFDQTSGAQTSAKDLTWSHAAFITAWQARKDALEAFSGRQG